MSGLGCKSKADAVLPLVLVVDLSDQSEREYISLTLAVNPADQDSPKYKAKFLVLRGDEDVRTMLKWRNEDVRTMLTWREDARPSYRSRR